MFNWLYIIIDCASKILKTCLYCSDCDHGNDILAVPGWRKIIIIIFLSISVVLPACKDHSAKKNPKKPALVYGKILVRQKKSLKIAK